jgi:hypothetical protein
MPDKVAPPRMEESAYRGIPGLVCEVHTILHRALLFAGALEWHELSFSNLLKRLNVKVLVTQPCPLGLVSLGGWHPLLQIWLCLA